MNINVFLLLNIMTSAPFPYNILHAGHFFILQGIELPALDNFGLVRPIVMENGKVDREESEKMRAVIGTE
jgi:hypothetical protein